MAQPVAHKRFFYFFLARPSIQIQSRPMGSIKSHSRRPWIDFYPPRVPPDINLDSYSHIMDVFDEAVEKYREQKAYTNMGASLTYRELNVLVDQFASFLQHELKLKKGDRIAIQIPNLLQYPVLLFGALRAGLIVVNTNPLYTAHEMLHQFTDSGVKSVVILANFAHQLETILSKTSLESVIITEIGDLLPFPKNWIVNTVIKRIKKMVPPYHIPHAYRFKQTLEIGAANPAKPIERGPEDIAFLQYTGGTTGVSKGAVLSHRNIIANILQVAEWMAPLFKPGQEILVTPLPLYHIFSLTVNIVFIYWGSENVLITNPKDISGFLKTLKGRHFTVMTGVNTLFNAMMNHPGFDKVDFSHLKLSVAGAMALQKTVQDQWHRRTSSRLIEGYGLTEASPVVSANPVIGHQELGTIGQPLPSTEVKLIKDNGEEVGPEEIDVPGELCVKGPQVMEGYWKQEKETQQCLSNGWLKTGDIAVFKEKGFLKIVDRKKDMILISGFNVYPNEVEEVLASHPKVLEVAAVGVPDEKSGEVVKAFIVKKDPSLTEDEVIEYAKKDLTKYKVPKFVEFRSELPKTNVGKILRRALR